jgi:hypothetical protein
MNSFVPSRITFALACTVLLAALACSKKEQQPPPPPAVEAVTAPTTGDVDKRNAEDPGRQGTASATETPAADVADQPALPAESGAGGAAVWLTAPNLGRTIDRAVRLLDALRPAGGEMLAGLPEGEALRGQVEMMLRGGLFGQLLGLGDPAVVDLAQPVRLRVSFPAAGAPMVVVSLGTTRPVEPLRSGKLVGLPGPDGRYLVGIGVEPDAAAAWPTDTASSADDDIGATIAMGSALPALVKALGDLQAMTAGLGGEEPMPAWLGDLVVGTARYVVEVSGIDTMSVGLRVGAGPAEAPLRMTMGIRPAAGTPMAAALTLLAQEPPPFGLLETVDAGGDMWLAARMNPAGIRQMLDAIGGPTEAFLGQALGEDWRAPVLDALRGLIESMSGVDGRMVGAMRTLSSGKGAFTLVWGVVAGQADAVRAGVRKLGAAGAALLAKLSDKFSFGATVEWKDAAAKSGAVEVDRLTIVVPRAALGPFAAALQPGEGDLRWDISIAVGPGQLVWTSDPDPAVIQRALAAQARGGGAAAGTSLAERLGAADPAVLELGWIDMSAGFRSNPMLACPPGTTFPSLPLHLEMRGVGGGFDVAMDFLPGAAAAIFPFAKAASACLPGKVETPGVPAAP